MAKPMYYWNGTTWEAVAPVVPQSPIAYQASAPSSPSTGDLWIDSDQDLDSYQRQLVRYLFNPASGATSVSGVDANGATLSYTPGAEQVYLNGALLVRGSDYVATNGTSITSLAALSSGDVLEVFAYVAFNPANTYTQSQVDGLVAPMGLVHLNTTSFSAVASQDVTGVFSSTYDNYLILVRAAAGADNVNLVLRLGSGGTYTATNVYSYGFNTVTRAGSANTESLNAGSGFRLTRMTTTTPSVSQCFIFSPNLTLETNFTMQGWNRRDNFAYSGGGYIENTTQYTDLRILPESSTITGTISVYGFRKS